MTESRRRGPNPLQRYDRRLTARTPDGAARRFLLGPVGNFLSNTALFVLPERLNLQPRHRVLDVQAGRGSLLGFLAARIPFEQPPVGLDASLPALQMARHETDADDRPPFVLIGGRPTYLPFADESFDLVIAAHVFRRLADHGLVQCLGEIERVLRPDGVMVAWEFAPRSSDRLNQLHLRLLAGDVLPPHLRGFGPLSHYALEAGFIRIERPPLRPFLFPPIPHTAILAQKRGPDEG